jgi:spore germination cell wall hydrolase CwlJ-like protein
MTDKPAPIVPNFAAGIHDPAPIDITHATDLPGADLINKARPFPAELAYGPGRVLQAPDPHAAIDSTELDTMARTIWGEARGEGITGMCAVASVIITRAWVRPGWWGKDVTGVCRAPSQFSCWLPGPDHTAMVAVTGADPAFAIARTIAWLALSGLLRDNTGGADSYYALSIPLPVWAIGRPPTATIGHQRFYRLA